MPSDWNSYYSKCERCGSTYHDSEGGCGCLDDYVECEKHNGLVFRPGYGNRPGRLVHVECHVHHDEVVEIGDKSYCEEHAICSECGVSEGLRFDDMSDELYCPKCWVTMECEELAPAE